MKVSGRISHFYKLGNSYSTLQDVITFEIASKRL